MLKTIQHKRSDVAGNKPLLSQVAVGELAINFADRSIYTRDGTSVLELARDVIRSATQPSAPIEGDFWYNTTTNSVSYWDGSAWSSVGAEAEYTRTNVTATEGQTTFSANYTVGYADVYLNGVKLIVSVDFTATDGNSVVLTSGASTGDSVEIISYQTFEVANALTSGNNLSDLSDPAIALTNLRITPIHKGSNYTAVAGDNVIVTTGGITITLPPSPSVGDTVSIKDGTGAAATTPFTVVGNGENIASSITDLNFDTNFGEITMSYINSTIGWSV